MTAAELTMLHAFDGEWSYYVRGHDPGELWEVDDPAELEHAALWMREIRASQAEDYGLYCDDDESVTRNPVTGKFEARMVWIECPATAAGAVAWMGVKYVSPPVPKEQR